MGHIADEEGEGVAALQEGQAVVHDQRPLMHDSALAEIDEAFCSQGVGRLLVSGHLLDGAVAENDPATGTY